MMNTSSPLGPIMAAIALLVAVVWAFAMPTADKHDAMMHSGQIEIHHAYARSGPRAGAAFFTIVNGTDQADRLVGATADFARKTELHTHIMEDGIAKMRMIDGGIAVPAHAKTKLERGGDHVMFMGLDGALAEGSEISFTLMFEKAGEVIVTTQVDNAHSEDAGFDHKGHKHH